MSGQTSTYVSSEEDLKVSDPLGISPFWNFFTVAMAWFLVIAVHRWTNLDSPPYIEQSISHWGEADWLVEHDFDFHRLRVKELHFEDGGPRVYWCSVVPAAMALAMETLPSTQAMIVGYRIVYVWLPAAIILGLCFALVREVQPLWIAFLVSAAVYVTPIVSVQIEMLGMDVAMVAMTMAWWMSMHRRRFALATVLGAIPFFLKPSAFVVPMGAAAYFGGLALLELYRERRARPRYWVLGLANVAVFAVQMILLVEGGNLRGRLMIFQDLGLWLKSSPDLLAILVFSFFMTILWVVRSIRAGTPSSPCQSLVVRLENFALASPLECSGWFVILLNLAAATVTYYESRHLTLVVPMVLVLLGRVTGRLGMRPAVFGACLAGFLVFEASNAFGRFYPALAPPVQRGWGVLERSLEYRADHESNIAASRLIDAKLRGEPLLAADQFLYFLKLSRLGYVRQSFGDGRHWFIVEDSNLLQLVEDQPPSLIVTYVTDQIGSWPFPAYVISKPEEGDEVLYHDRLDPPTIIYRRTFDTTGSSADRMRQYVDLLFSDVKDVDPAVRLAVVGSERLALRYVAADLGKPSADPRVRPELVRRLSDYLNQLDAILAERPDDFIGIRRRDVARERLRCLQAGKPLSPLPWTQRTYLETWPQRLQYMPAEQTQLTLPVESDGGEPPLGEGSP